MQRGEADEIVERIRSEVREDMREVAAEAAELVFKKLMGEVGVRLTTDQDIDEARAMFMWAKSVRAAYTRTAVTIGSVVIVALLGGFFTMLGWIFKQHVLN